MTLDDDDTIRIRFEDGETVMRALKEYRDRQLESIAEIEKADEADPESAAADVVCGGGSLAEAFRQAAANTERLMKEIEAQL